MDIIGSTYLDKDSPFKTPAFIDAKDIPEGVDGYSICTAIEESAGQYNIDTMQRVGNTYRIYLLSNGSKSKLCSKGISINNTTIPVYAENPFTTVFKSAPGQKKQSIRILIKDLYRSVASEVVEQMLVHKFGLQLGSPIKYACWRNRKRELTNIKNGDRFVFVSAEQLDNNPLPREAYCGRFKVRIFHDGQFRGQRECSRCWSTDHTVHTCNKPKCCRVCKNEGHEPGTPDCEFYCREESILPFGGADDPFSSLFHGSFTHNHLTYHSSEQAYLYGKSMKVGDTELAKKILGSRDAKHAKRLSKQLRCVPDWDDSEIAVNMMTEICIDKFREVEACYEAMRKAHAENKELVEAVWKPGSNNIWGTALTKEQTKYTKREGWKGKNQLGDILTKIMHHMFDDWIEEEHSDTEDGLPSNGLPENGLPENVQSQDNRDNTSQISDGEQSVEEDKYSQEETEEGELDDEGQLESQASNSNDITTLDSDNAENLVVKPEHISRKSEPRAKRLGNVGRVKVKSRSPSTARSVSSNRKRVNTSPKESAAKKDKVDPNVVDPKSKSVLAKPRFKPGAKVS